MIGEDFAGVLAGAQRGNEAAYARLWRDANPPLLRYLRVVSSGDAEDVAAETWATVVRGMTRFSGDENCWRAWLFATARRRAIDDGRSRARHRDLPVGDVAALADLPGLTVPADDPADLVLVQYAVEEALAAVRRLPTLQAEVLMLRLVAGLPTESVAELLGSTPGAVRVAAHRGLKRLSTEMSRNGVTL